MAVLNLIVDDILRFFDPDLPVGAAEKQQRISLPYDDILDFRNEDRVVSGILRGVQAALEISQRTMQNWGAVLGTIEAGSGFLLGVLMGRRRAGVILGNHALALRQDIHSKPLSRMQVSMGTRPMVDANQDQRGIQRHGCKCIRSHPVHFAFKVDGDDCDSSGEAAHGFAEFG